MAPKKKSETTIAEKYIKLDPREHVLKRPNLYIGSVEEDTFNAWVVNDDNTKIIKKTVKYIPGLLKIFDEILVNAIDHSIRLKELKEHDDDVNLMKNIKVNISKETGIISVFNDGNGLDIIIHPEHKMYIPEMIFGHLMTSTNYDDTTERIIGGTNGVGSKAANIFSKWFQVDTIDSKRKLMYNQKFENNMLNKTDPSITKYTKKPYTIISFLPDYEKFGLKNLSDDMYQLMKKRVYDTCANTDNTINIYFNDEKLDYKNFEKYVDLYLGDKSNHSRVYEKINDRWEIVASYNEYTGFDQISFVNSIWTLRGGKHVDYILNQITKKLTELIVKKNKNAIIKPNIIKDNLILFVKSTIVNPAFDNQAKESLTTPITKFGSKAEVSDTFITKLYKTGIVEKILEFSQINENKTLQKTDGKKKNIIRGIPKLEDANWAGTNKSNECVLLLTEGDSAATMALAGLSDIGRDKFGIFPLKGKVMNVKDASVQKIADNDEITNIKKILGLESGKDYKDLNDLRYGSIMVMTDSDDDGKHIMGLLFNVFHSLWPSLIKNNTFMTSLLTPIVKVTKGTNTLQFYSLTDYENWEKNNNTSGWTIKYYKGLGTSTKKEAKDYFTDMKRVQYIYNKDHSDQALDLAFNKKKADDRKEWLSNYDRQNVLDFSKKDITYEEFINKGLIHFSNYDVQRSIPSMIDGLKISQRKILFGCFKRNIVDKEIKVAQLAAYVSETTAYHHGEASLQGTIVGMAQNFVGANNINLLQPNGQFGSRVHNGSDAAQPRYIFTQLTPICSKIFIKDDQNILNYLNDDGLDIEPDFYIPIIPMILVNGALGIGTGFSTNIPCYNPSDIISILQKLIKNEEVDDELIPWYNGFTGTIEKINNKYYSKGKYTKLSVNKIEITELPIGTSIFDFKCMLEELLDKKADDFRNYENNSTDDQIKFMIQFMSTAVLEEYLTIQDNGFTKLENELKLVSSKLLGTTNMYAFNEHSAIQKYDSPTHIIKDFYKLRILYYQKRKDYLVNKIKYDMDLLQNKIRFIREVVNENIVIQKLKKIELENRLDKDLYMKHDNSYDYIIRIPVYNLTIDKVEELEAEYKRVYDKYNSVLSKDIKETYNEELIDLKNIINNSIVKIVANKKKLINKVST